MKFILTVKMSVRAIDLQERNIPVKPEDWEKFQSSISGELVKIKTGVYENALMGVITKVTPTRKSRGNRK